MLEEDCSRERNSSVKAPGSDHEVGKDMTPQAGQVRDIQSTEAKDGHYKGKALFTSNVVAIRPSSFNSIDTPCMLCVMFYILTTKAAPSSPQDSEIEKESFHLPSHQPNSPAGLNLPRHLPQGCVGQSDRMLQKSTGAEAGGRLFHSHTRRNSEQPKQSRERRVKLEDSHSDWGQSCSDQDSVVLAQRQTHGPIKQNTEPRN